jgi:tryptophan 2,3-dioxygenase
MEELKGDPVASSWRAILTNRRGGVCLRAVKLARVIACNIPRMSTPGYDKSEKVDLSDERIHWDMGASLSYSQYLQLDKILDAQKPLSGRHDEMLFIIVHQTSELWLRLFLHELAGVLRCVRKDELDPSFKMLSRISRVQSQLIATWDVLATMTPAEYSEFRNALGRSSGFQSFQYRLLEFQLGNKNAEMINVHQHDSKVHQMLERALKAPSLYDEVLRLLSRRGYGIPEDYLNRDFTQPYRASKQVAGAWLGVYHNAEKDWDLYELAERLVDLDQKFQLWRCHHLKTVERIIGYKPGTGGTAGVSYLAKALELKFFPELWQVRTSM